VPSARRTLALLACAALFSPREGFALQLQLSRATTPATSEPAGQTPAPAAAESGAKLSALPPPATAAPASATTQPGDPPTAQTLPAAAAPRPIRGPLGLRIQGTLRELFLDPILLDARPLDAPVLDLRWAVANTWNLPMQVYRGHVLVDHYLDEQADSLTLSLRAPWSRLLGEGPQLAGSGRGLFARLSTQLEWRATLHWGGWSDRPIEAWHSLTGAFNYERQMYPRNQLRLLLRDSNGVTLFDLQSATFAPGDPVLRTQLVLWEGEASALSARLDLKAPLGSPARAGSSGGFDGALTLAWSGAVLRWLTLHAQLAGALYAGFDSPIAVQPNTLQLFADASAQVHFGPVDGFVEDRIGSALLAGGWDRWERVPFLGDNGWLSSGDYATFRPHNQISFGARYAGLSLWLSEDFTPGSNPHSALPILYVSNAPDVTIGLSWTHGL
jgi:Protein of unknown function (DUF3187)